MNVEYKAKSLQPTEYDNDTYEVEQVTLCPICKKSISPVHLNSVFRGDDNFIYIESHLLCKGCFHSFIASYRCSIARNGDVDIGELISAEPNKFKEQIFDDCINSLSPNFVKIYNQALAAETSGLNEIAGLGYRKALEFLIKDFVIHEHPNDKEAIKKMFLGNCIKTYIDDPRIKTLAERSIWLGNDEAHYVRKHTDRDVNDMKSFIKATEYSISVVLITKDAASMSPK